MNLAALIKLAGMATAAFGIQANNWRDMTLGGIVTVITHWIDSVHNSPVAAQPKVGG